MTPSYTEGNCEKLAKEVAAKMELEDLRDYVVTVLMDMYLKQRICFYRDWKQYLGGVK